MHLLRHMAGMHTHAGRLAGLPQPLYRSPKPCCLPTCLARGCPVRSLYAMWLRVSSTTDGGTHFSLCCGSRESLVPVVGRSHIRDSKWCDFWFSALVCPTATSTCSFWGTSAPQAASSARPARPARPGSPSPTTRPARIARTVTNASPTTAACPARTASPARPVRVTWSADPARTARPTRSASESTRNWQHMLADH